MISIHAFDGIDDFFEEKRNDQKKGRWEKQEKYILKF